MCSHVDTASVGLIYRVHSQGWNVCRTAGTDTVICPHEYYQVLLQSYSDSHHRNAILNITHVGKRDRKKSREPLEQCVSTGLNTVSEFWSPGASPGKFSMNFMNFWVCKCHDGSLLFTHNAQMFFYIYDLRECYYINCGWGHFFRQVPSFTHKCPLLGLQQWPDASNKLKGPLSCTRGSQWHKPQCSFPDKLSVKGVLF